MAQSRNTWLLQRNSQLVLQGTRSSVRDDRAWFEPAVGIPLGIAVFLDVFLHPAFKFWPCPTAVSETLSSYRHFLLATNYAPVPSAGCGVGNFRPYIGPWHSVLLCACRTCLQLLSRHKFVVPVVQSPKTPATFFLFRLRLPDFPACEMSSVERFCFIFAAALVLLVHFPGKHLTP
uniref:Uncharacterized protein n=1 Tax=Eutreptiella gymnastica TaxID=73025 RepID=A0A7S4D0J7_9EUGL